MLEREGRGEVSGVCRGWESQARIEGFTLERGARQKENKGGWIRRHGCAEQQ